MIDNFELVEEQQSAGEADFPLAIRSPLEALFISYDRSKEQILGISEFLGNKNNSALNFFFQAASVHDRWASTLQLDRLFDSAAAIKALDAASWQKAIMLTDVLDVMPAQKRNDWNESIRQHETPEFEREVVLGTLQDLLLQRETFFCERVDGLFRNLSGTHVTNAPEGFSKRMIMDYFICSYGSLNYDRIAYIHDLRFVVASFMGREQPSQRLTTDLITRIYRSDQYGVWHSFDGGAFRFKLYKKGTAHVEIHPDMAWRLNSMLAKLHPMAIPTRFRKQPVRPKAFNLTMDLISEGALLELNALRADSEGRRQNFSLIRDASTQRSPKARQEAESVLERLGGVATSPGIWDFDYDSTEVIHEVIRVGKLPDGSFQYFATPESLARHVVDLADINDADTILEPSAGQGGIADYLPTERLTCIEISKLHCTVLKSKGHRVIEGDFLTLPARRYRKIVMNPPFSGNRATLHVRHAAQEWLAPGGRLVAILPASLKGKSLVPDWEHEYSEVFADSFKGTSVSVVVLTLDRPR